MRGTVPILLTVRCVLIMKRMIGIYFFNAWLKLIVGILQDCQSCLGVGMGDMVELE
jgi:hypothetical protein